MAVLFDERDTETMVFVYIFGPTILGFILGGVLGIDHRITVNRRFSEAQKAFEKFFVEHGGNMSGKTDEVTAIFAKYGHEVVQQTETDLIFRHPTKVDPISYWLVLLTIITFGGALGFVVAFKVFGRPGENVSVTLGAVDA